MVSRDNSAGEELLGANEGRRKIRLEWGWLLLLVATAESFVNRCRAG